MREISSEVIVEASRETVQKALAGLGPGPEPHLAFAWRGRARVRGVFDGTIGVRLEALGERRTRLQQIERFKGILSRLVGEGYYERARRDLEAANLAVKAWAEELGPARAAGEAAARDAGEAAA